MQFRHMSVREISRLFPFIDAHALSDLELEDRLPVMDIGSPLTHCGFDAAAVVLRCEGSRRGVFLHADHWRDGKIVLGVWIDKSFFQSLNDPRTRSIGQDQVQNFCNAIGLRNWTEVYAELCKELS